MKECNKLIEMLKEEYSYENIFNILRSHGSLIASEHTDAKGGIVRETYKEMTARARKVGGSLKKDGVTSGCFVGIQLANSPDWPVIYWGVLCAGANVLLLDAKADRQTTRHLLSQAGAKILITEDKSVLDGIKKLSASAVLSSHGGKPAKTFGHMTAICTSGTTETARVFVYDDRTVGHQLENTGKIVEANHSIAYGPSKGPMRHLAFLPFHHIFGFMAVYMWFSFLGASMVYPADMSPQCMLETCRRHKVTHVFAVPMFWNNIAKAIIRKSELGGNFKKRQFETLANVSIMLQKSLSILGNLLGSAVFKSIQDALFGSNIRFMISGGGHILPGTLRIINAVGYPLHNGFGMTETGITSVDLSMDINDRIGGGVGKPFSSVKYRVDEDGEIVVSGDSIFSGQMINGAYVPRAGEWFYTGDVGRLENGILYIEGRKKETIINSSGENVYPDELEDHFSKLPGAEQLCITGVASVEGYEDITLIYYSRDDSPEHRSQIVSFVAEINEKLPMNKRVTRIYASAHELPTANGIKVRRQKLREFIEQSEWEYDQLEAVAVPTEQKVSQKDDNTDERYLAIKEECRSLFAEALYLKPEDIGDTDRFVADLGGDSLTLIGVIAKLEEKYDIEISDEEFAGLNDLRELSSFLYSKRYGK